MVKPLVINISADYPDAADAAKSSAIARLVDGSAGEFEHRVYSLNRRGRLWNALVNSGTFETADDDGKVASLIYRAPPLGLALHRSMCRIGETIAHQIAETNRAPALVHGHKLSFEGIAAHIIAKRLGIPFALTLQGNTDKKVIAARPDLRSLYRRIWQGAGAVFATSPWIAEYCSRTLGERAQPPIILPCITNAKAIIPPRQDVSQRLVTAFRLDKHVNKNLRRVIQAVSALRPRHQGLELEIAGGGSPQDEQTVDAMIEAANASAFIRRVGRVQSDAIQAWMNGASAYVMPSHRESFGMVNIEALLSGCPILYSRGTGVDGYFPGASFAVGCDPASSAGIAHGIGKLLANWAEIAIELASWQRGHGARFLAPAIIENYCRELRNLIERTG